MVWSFRRHYTHARQYGRNFTELQFCKSYAFYGGFFIVLSLLWAYQFDKYSPTKYDIAGSLIALLGVCIIYYAPGS